MSRFQTVHSFWLALANEKHTLGSDAFKARLLDVPLDLDWDVWADCSADEIANGNGYSTGGLALTLVSWGLDSANVPRLIFQTPTWTSSGAGMASYQTLIILNDTAPSDELVGGIDYGFNRGVPAGEVAPIYLHQTDGILGIFR